MDWQLQNPSRFREVNGNGASPNTMMRPWNEPAIVGAGQEVYGGCISYAPASNAFRGRPQRMQQPEEPDQQGEPEEVPRRPQRPGRGGDQQEPPRRWRRVNPPRRGPIRSPIRHRFGRRSLEEPQNSTVHASDIEIVDVPEAEEAPRVCYGTEGVETPCPDDRENIIDLRAPIVIPEDYLLRNKQNVTAVRYQESETRKIIHDLNDLEGYVSPCALLNREDILTKLAKGGTEFKQVVKGKLIKMHLSKRESVDTFVKSVKKEFTRHGVTVVKSFSYISKGIHRILGHGADYMKRKFRAQPGTIYYEEEEDEYCEEEDY